MRSLFGMLSLLLPICSPLKAQVPIEFTGDSGSCQIDISTINGASYSVELSTDLIAYSTIMTNIAGNGGNRQVNLVCNLDAHCAK